MENMIYFVVANFIILLAILLILIFKKSKVEVDIDSITSVIRDELSRLKKEQMDENSNQRIELNSSLQSIKEEINKNLNENKTELNGSLDLFRTLINEQLGSLTKQTNENNEKIIKKQDEIRQETEKKLESTNVSLSKAFEDLQNKLQLNLQEFGDKQKITSDEYIKKHDEIKKSTEEKLEFIRKTVEDKMQLMQEGNEKKLEEMRKTVDQKLQETLDKKLSESFNNVSQQLKEVYIGLGEMKTLASDVGGLKRALTNVKTKGILGEIQLGAILESILSPEQYETNVAIKPNSQQNVEYAIKLPGKDDQRPYIYLPIDSKFPFDTYEKLTAAKEEPDNEKIKQYRKELDATIKKCAKDIKDKYIHIPYSTDFAILFLPIEGLFAEVLQRPKLIREIQEEYKVVIAGPTTLSAFINSLQMGFKTLAIEKRSSEVWSVLSNVKKQFEMFSDIIKLAQKNLSLVSGNLDDLSGKRTRKIVSALKNVEILPEHTYKEELLQSDNQGDDISDSED
ncbi:MAG TPA: DNA recombination protein RmuC [Candidatus Cloacimonadota bacterium]|jgi:DNA recombination protein RmuC|nr:DNA recombination protein RmuC [Candidatus Cloacimonadales bacterium]HPY95999.1 DNA recombination protein RmuC [Candidatus Cloacimonadota bacterium]HQB40605.1 DNA recombination protein RmuC [Candidatus Cloacimonadota bacterium]